MKITTKAWIKAAKKYEGRTTRDAKRAERMIDLMTGKAILRLSEDLTECGRNYLNAMRSSVAYGERAAKAWGRAAARESDPQKVDKYISKQAENLSRSSQILQNHVNGRQLLT